MGNAAIPVLGNYSQWVVPAIDNASVRIVPRRNGGFEHLGGTGIELFPGSVPTCVLRNL